MAAAAPGVLIVGGGLAGSLLALALRQRGAAVTLIESDVSPHRPTATAWSYGAIPGWPLAPNPLARAAAGAAGLWRDLQRRHGDLGWRPVRARLLGAPPGLDLLARSGLLPLSQVQAPQLLARLPSLLAAAGVVLHHGEAVRLDRRGPAWAVHLADGTQLGAAQLVIAAGAGCRWLWPCLPGSLRCSWAGVLEMPDAQPQGRRGRPELLLPAQFRRIALERRADRLDNPDWVVDPGCVPRDAGSLLGQLSWMAPAGVELATAVPASPGPDPRQAEAWLRGALAEADPALAAWVGQDRGRYRQVPVAFCTDGRPLAAPVADAAGLWLFSGFSGGFAQVPVLAPLLAAAITAERETAPAIRELQRLGVWPEEIGWPGAPSS